MDAIFVLLFAGVFIGLIIKNGKLAGSCLIAILIGAPLAGLLEGLFSGHQPTWIAFLVAVAFYIGTSMNKK